LRPQTVSARLLDEIETVILGPMTDGRMPLPRRLTPVPGYDDDPNESTATSELVMRSLHQAPEPRAAAEIAEDIARDDDSVERALIVLHLSEAVVKIPGRYPKWRVAA
jgi:hypothetical protein